MNIVKGIYFFHTKQERPFQFYLSSSGFEPGSLPNLSSELRVKLGSRNNPIIQSNRRSINLFSIQECIFGIRRIQGKLRSAVWTVYRPARLNTVSRDSRIQNKTVDGWKRARPQTSCISTCVAFRLWCSSSFHTDE
jgi:hypothetical protein